MMRVEFAVVTFRRAAIRNGELCEAVCTAATRSTSATSGHAPSPSIACIAQCEKRGARGKLCVRTSVTYRQIHQHPSHIHSILYVPCANYVSLYALHHIHY